ncbi:MAG: hypothetical protein IT158_14300 [Bryobacterales bacterium]|nr:hypothetical protein [Bryobacterales bacterium]
MTPSPEAYSVPRRALDIEDYIDILRRHWSWLVAPGFAGLVIGVVVAFLWPDTYLSWATLRIVPSQVPERVIPSNFNRQMAERLDAIVQEVISRDRLIGIIQKVGLYKSELQRKPMEDVWQDMRSSIRVMNAGPQQGTRGLSYVFQISFQYKDRYDVRRALDQIVAELTNEVTTERRMASEQTRDFLREQQVQAKKALDEIEAQRTAFRMRYAGTLPESMQANFQAVQSLQVQLASVNEAINRAGQEKLMLEAQLQNFRDQMKVVGSMEGGNDAVKNERLIQLNRALLDMETGLSALRDRYREEHPDIRATKARLEVLRRERDKLSQEEAKNAQSQPETRVVSPLAMKSMRDLEMGIRNLEGRIQANQMEVEERLKLQKRLNEQIRLFQGRIEAAPVGEGEYNKLTRDYALAKERYDDLTLKVNQSEMAAQVEDRLQGETLEPIERAFIPGNPIEPNRWMIVLSGVGIGLMLGACLAGAREAKDTSLKNLKDVRAYANVPVLSTIPLLENAVVLRRKRRLVWLAWSAALILGVMIMSSAIAYYFWVVQKPGTPV